jgi:hypothetical protein
MFLFDAQSSEIDVALRLLNTLGTSLQQEFILGTRNGIVHPKKQFPSREDLLRCCTVLRDSMMQLESAGLVPILWGTIELLTDAFGRKRVTSTDYAGGVRNWFPSPALQTIPTLPPLNSPQVLVSCFHIASTNEPLRFRMQEESDFTEMWKDYPKRTSPTAREAEILKHENASAV